MTQLLISVTSIDEAEIALQNGADIIDLKDPEQGALGALPLEVVAEIVAFVNAKGVSERKIISATIGDLPMEPALLLQHVVALSETDVDIIKIGFFAGTGALLTDYQACLDMLRTVSASGVRLIAVLFVEYDYPANLLMAIKNAGFYGVMFDTVGKNGATFLDYYSMDAMKAIAQDVQAQDLLFGLAGSLNLQHVALVKSIAPDYIGFRGGVCINNHRRLALSADKIKAIRAVI